MKANTLALMAALVALGTACDESTGPEEPHDASTASDGAMGDGDSGEPDGAADGSGDDGSGDVPEAGPDSSPDVGADAYPGADAGADVGVDAWEDAVPDTGSEGSACGPDPYPGATCETAIYIPVTTWTTDLSNDTACGSNLFPGGITCGGATTFDGPELYFAAGGFLTLGCTFVPEFDAELYILSPDGCVSAGAAESQCSTGDHWHVPAGQAQGFGWSYGGDYVVVVDSAGPGGPFSLLCTGTQDPDIP